MDLQGVPSFLNLYTIRLESLNSHLLKRSPKKSWEVISNMKRSGQIIATSHDLTPKGS